ncbi:thioesterase family protein [Gordonia humi]|uniref:Acyl-coenzyme A thioesterase PaaI-like protein n=1 Tax=Gordonia humi TaxID=686429 RepID=A0A840EVJ0_9ACTN|nr:thioesterase family protein [Gordonia humi]MBB4136975.1 acyl-coenzyme A thioesterase PaaI-like protein [Gordonia humi]
MTDDFTRATTVTATDDPHRFHAEVDPRWTVVGNPNGGYLQAIAARAATASSPHPHVVAATTTFVAAPRPGAVVLDTEVLRSGRTATQIRARLSQEGTPRLETVFVFGDLTAATAPQWESADQPTAGLPFAECPRFAPPREVFPVELLHTVHLHMEDSSLAFTRGRGRGIGEMRGWLDLPDQAPHDPFSLLLAADVMPAATFDVTEPGWVPTLSLSTYVRALPVPGPVQVLLRANLIRGDRVDETCTVRDRTGAIVAQSHQLAGIRMP